MKYKTPAEPHRILRQLRTINERRGSDMRKLAEQIGVSYPQLGSHLRGDRNATVGQADRIAGALGMELCLRAKGGVRANEQLAELLEHHAQLLAQLAEQLRQQADPLI